MNMNYLIGYVCLGAYMKKAHITVECRYNAASMPDMTLMEVSQHAYKYSYVRTI